MANGKRILIVDDEPLIRRALSDYLTECGYEATTAPDGVAGLALARGISFDVALVDLRMPRLDGMDVIVALKTERPGLPVVVISGTGVLDDAIEAMRQGAWDYMTKPIRDMDEVIVVVERVLEKARLMADRDQYQGELEKLNRSLEAQVAAQTADLKRVNLELERLLMQVQEQAQRVQQIIDTVPEGVLLLGAGGPDGWRVALGNPLAQKYLPTLTSTGVGDHLVSLGDRSVAELLSTPPEGLWHEITAGSQRFQVIAHAIELEPMSGGWVMVIRDVTQEREVERRVQQQERLAAIGRLTAGIAHDFNNHLTAITGYSELLMLEMAEDDPRRADVEEIKHAAARSAALTYQLLAFSRKQIIQPEVLNLNDLITNMKKMLDRLIGENIELITVLDPRLALVEVDPGQLDQVIVNLVVNARDAMPSGGQLVIETLNVDVGEDDAAQHADVSPGSYVVLAVRDNGIGMGQETLAHLFEPFFTTKERGKGTGLGLATVYGIVKQSGGGIEVFSEPGQGAVFKVYLPRVRRAMAAQDDEHIIQPSQGAETVLLAEDEESVRVLARRILQHDGYTIIEASDAATALALAQECQQHIHLLLTDVIMPGGMSGEELARQLVTQRPSLKVLYISGYTDDAIAQHGVLEPGIHFLQKPFTAASLSHKVRKVLDE